MAREFVGRGYSVVATYHIRQPVGVGDAEWIRLDLEDPGSVVETVRVLRPDVVVHCAAYTDVDGCELHRDRAYRVNYLATRALARACGSIGAYMVYISTDYVFDGKKGMYREDNAPNPVNYYGLAKLLGEAVVESILDGQYCIGLVASTAIASRGRRTLA